MKKIIAIAALATMGFTANAQTQTNQTSSASQTAKLVMSNAIEITFNGSAEGADVSIPFTTVNDYANGVESGAQELKVRSNKNFSVAVKASSDKFNYVGTTSPAPSMPVSGVLGVLVSSNNTGGTIATPFSGTAYSTLTKDNQNLISAGRNGGNQTFAVKYKATPGFAYPAGTYSVDVVYTATQQ